MSALIFVQIQTTVPSDYAYEQNLILAQAKEDTFKCMIYFCHKLSPAQIWQIAVIWTSSNALGITAVSREESLPRLIICANFLATELAANRFGTARHKRYVVKTHIHPLHGYSSTYLSTSSI